MNKSVHQIFPVCLLFVLIFFSCTASCEKKNKSVPDKPYVVMLSLDGFRWDYPNKTSTPNLDKIAEILGLDPAPVDGKLENVKTILIDNL